MTTKVKKKGVLAYQEAPQRKNRAVCGSRSRRESLQFKSTNPLQETENCSWPKINLAVPSTHRNPADCNNLDFGTQENFFFFLNHARIWITDGLHYAACCIYARVIVHP